MHGASRHSEQIGAERFDAPRDARAPTRLMEERTDLLGVLACALHAPPEPAVVRLPAVNLLGAA